LQNISAENRPAVLLSRLNVNRVNSPGKQHKIIPSQRHDSGRPKFGRRQPSTREFLTVLETICGDGTADIAPAIIFKAHNLLSKWFDNLDHNSPDDILFGQSPNEWTDQKKALAYLERNFGPGSKSALKAGQTKYRCLIFDGYNRHVNSAFLTRCLEYRLLPY
jgi:hypothetical protein